MGIVAGEGLRAAARESGDTDAIVGDSPSFAVARHTAAQYKVNDDAYNVEFIKITP